MKLNVIIILKIMAIIMKNRLLYLDYYTIMYHSNKFSDLHTGRFKWSWDLRKHI